MRSTYTCDENITGVSIFEARFVAFLNDNVKVLRLVPTSHEKHKNVRCSAWRLVIKQFYR